MKKQLTLLALVFTVLINAQTKFDKTITVTIKDFSEGCGQDPGDAIFCLTDDKGNPIKERFSCNMESNAWQVEPKDLITENWTLNPKYKGKKATLYCTKHGGGAGWVVIKVEFDGDKKTTGAVSENDLDKYIGVYIFLKYKITINKFPVSSKVKIEQGSKYLPLDKKFIGKYFMVDDYGVYADTNKTMAPSGGYIAPPVGNIILSVSKDGEITIQNYNNYGTSDKGTVMEFKLGGTGVNGKFILRDDGKYDLLIKNARYVWTKK